MLDLDVIDAHHHLWDLRFSYPWLQESAGRLKVQGPDAMIRRTYLLDDYLKDVGALRLMASVHVEAGAGDPFHEASWLQALADERGFPQGIVAATRLDAEGIAETLERLNSVPNVRGIRQILNWHADPGLRFNNLADLMADGPWLAGYSRLKNHDMSFDMQVYPPQLRDAAKVAADNPDTLMILNHAGMPLARDEASLSIWRSGLRELARQSNTAVKISGLGMTDHTWTVESLRPIVLDTIEAFGVERTMFASNFPVDSLYSSLGSLYEAFDTITAEFSTDERSCLFSRTAQRIYRLELQDAGSEGYTDSTGEPA